MVGTSAVVQQYLSKMSTVEGDYKPTHTHKHMHPLLFLYHVSLLYNNINKHIYILNLFIVQNTNLKYTITFSMINLLSVHSKFT